MSVVCNDASKCEAVHQNALLSALYRRSDVLPNAAKSYDTGLNAYRNNGSLNAARALSLMFPSLYALLGKDDFYPLARLYWLAQPPQRGDWSQYGDGFADWIAANNPGGILDSLPHLPDLARLDDAINRSQDAPNATVDLSTLALLEGDPVRLRVVLHPSVRVIELKKDIVAYRAALLDNAHDAIAAPSNATFTPSPTPCYAIAARQDWRAAAIAIGAAGAVFVRQCLTGATVLQAHDTATALDASFDAAHWLSQAIPAQWVLRVELIAVNG